MITCIYRKFYCDNCDFVMTAIHPSQDCPEVCPKCYTRTEEREIVKIT